MASERIFIVSEDDLRRVVAEAVREAVGEPRSDLRLFTPEEAAERLGVTRRTILKWARAGRLPCRELGEGKVVRFSESDLASAGVQERKAG